MKIHYSKDANAIYIKLKNAEVFETDSITENLILDYDKSGKVIGIEILSADINADLNELVVQTFNQIKIENNQQTV